MTEAHQQKPAYHILDRHLVAGSYFGHQARMELHSVYYFLPSNVIHF